ncbi:MAG: GNAT family N-acetyltransferase [Alteromonadales bacterium]|nr:GNAT family N-acetyltransferase [Alteromonadales bacterium]
MVTIREIELADTQMVQKHASEPVIGKMSNVPSPYPKDGALLWYKHIEKMIEKGTSKVFVIENQGEFSGVISLNQLCYIENRVNIDYWIRADQHGKGIATKALSKAVKLAGNLGISNCFSSCLSRNHGSKKVLLNNGFSIVTISIIPEGKFEGEELLLLSL